MKLFDRRRLVPRKGAPFADFLYDYVAVELLERLQFVQREFDYGLIFAPASATLARRWAASPIPFVTVSPVPSPHAKVCADLLVPFSRTAPLLISLNAVHLADDPVSALGELRGALRPDGLFLGAVAQTGTLGELSECLIEAETALRDGAAMRVAPLADVRRWGDALSKAGFALPVADELSVTVRYDELANLFADLGAMGMRGVLHRRERAPRRLFERAEELYRERYSDPDGRLRATFSFALLSGWAPDASQQKPARRGSGQMGLEDALKMFAKPKDR